MSDVFIIVPAYNEQEAIGAVVSELREHYENVVVIDDGSTDATADEARRAGATVLTHILNRGQGAALQTGIEFALARGAGVVVSFDADGQHRVEDVGLLLAALERADVAIGSRFMGVRSEIPFVRRVTLRVAALFMRLMSGLPLTDAHNGLRAMRAAAAAKIHLRLDRMAHASEIIDQIAAERLRVVEVPVVVRYSPYARRKGQSSAAAVRIAFDYVVQRWFR